MGCPQAEPGRVAGPWLDGAGQPKRAPLGKVPFQFGSLSSAADKGSPLLTAGISKERAVVFHREKACSLVPGLPRLHPLGLFTELFLIRIFCGKTIIVSKSAFLSSVSCSGELLSMRRGSWEPSVYSFLVRNTMVWNLDLALEWGQSCGTKPVNLWI